MRKGQSIANFGNHTQRELRAGHHRLPRDFSFPQPCDTLLANSRLTDHQRSTMMSTTSLVINTAAIALYLAGAFYLVHQTVKQQAGNPRWVIPLIIGALTLHAVGSYLHLMAPLGLNLGFFKVGALIFWVINLIVLLSGLKKPMHSLFIFLFPLSALALAMATFSGESTVQTSVSGEIVVHILLSILAYSLLIIATLQAVLLAYQDYQLRHKHPTGPIRLLPPLQTMESLFFDMLWAGEILLTLSIVTGFLFLDNMFAQHLAHKTFLSLLAWVIYAILLVGHWRLGWRGYTAIRWALGGFIALMLAYFGSKFVLEILLG